MAREHERGRDTSLDTELGSITYLPAVSLLLARRYGIGAKGVPDLEGGNSRRELSSPPSGIGRWRNSPARPRPRGACCWFTPDNPMQSSE